MFLIGYIEVTACNKMDLHSVFTNASLPYPALSAFPTPPTKKGCAKVLSTSGTALLTLTYNSKRRLSIIFLLCFLHVVAGRQSIELLKHS